MRTSPQQPRRYPRAGFVAALALLAAIVVLTELEPSSARASRPRALAAADSGGGSAGRPESDQTAARVYELAVAAADVDTELDSYLAPSGAIAAQCQRLNQLLSVCCERFEVGCAVGYTCARLDLDERDRMTRTANLYSREHDDTPGYALHHGSVLDDLTRFFRTLQLFGRVERKLPVAYTRHPLRIDDEETKNRRNKIDRRDPAFLLLGSVLPGLSARDGTRMRLDYYASRDGLLLNVAPTRQSSLAQAVAEYRANLFSFHQKQFTGRGARDLFELVQSEAVPRFSGCQALAVQEPAHVRPFWRAKG